MNAVKRNKTSQRWDQTDTQVTAIYTWRAEHTHTQTPKLVIKRQNSDTELE